MAERHLSIRDFEDYKKKWQQPTDEYYRELWEKKKLQPGFVFFRLCFTEKADKVNNRYKKIGKQGASVHAEKVDGVRVTDGDLYRIGLIPRDVYTQREMRKVINKLQESNVDGAVRDIRKLELAPNDRTIFELIFSNVVNERIEMTEKSELVGATVKFASKLFSDSKAFVEYCLNKIRGFVCTEEHVSEKYYKACAVLLARMYPDLISLDVLIGTVIRILKSAQPPERIKLLFVATILLASGPAIDKNGKFWEGGKETTFTKMSILYSLMFDIERRGVLKGQEGFEIVRSLESRWKTTDSQVSVKPSDEVSVKNSEDFWRTLFVDWQETQQPRQLELLFKDLTCARAQTFDDLFTMLFDKITSPDDEIAFIGFMCDATKWIFDKGFLGWNMNTFLKHFEEISDKWEYVEFLSAFKFIVQLGMSQQKTVDILIGDLENVFLKQCTDKLSIAKETNNFLFDEDLILGSEDVDALTRLKAGKRLCDLCERLFDKSDEQDKEVIFRDCVWNLMIMVWDENGEKMKEDLLAESALYVGCMVWEVVSGWAKEDRKIEDLQAAMQPILALRTTPLVSRHCVENQDIVQWFVETSAADNSLELDESAQKTVMSVFQ